MKENTTIKEKKLNKTEKPIKSSLLCLLLLLWCSLLFPLLLVESGPNWMKIEEAELPTLVVKIFFFSLLPLSFLLFLWTARLLPFFPLPNDSPFLVSPRSSFIPPLLALVELFLLNFKTPPECKKWLLSLCPRRMAMQPLCMAMRDVSVRKSFSSKTSHGHAKLVHGRAERFCPRLKFPARVCMAMHFVAWPCTICLSVVHFSYFAPKILISRTSPLFITTKPEGLKELVNLESLDMSWTNLKEKIIPKGTLSKLHRLKQLIFPVEVQVCDPEVLNQLEAFHGYLSFADICEPFIISHWPTYYRLLFVGCFSAGWNNFRPYPNIHEHVLDKSLVFHGCDFQRGLDVASLPKDIEGLELRKCVVDQSDVFQILNSSNDLLDLRIKSLEGVEFLLKLSTPPPPPSELKAIPYGPLQKLETLDLMFLPDLVGFFDNQLLLPPGTFSSLEDVDIHGCDKMTKLFTVQLLQSLKNLKKLDVSDCKEVEEIAANEEEQAGGNGGGGILPSSSGTTNTLTLSQLFYLSLIGLPRLKNICKAAMTCNSIQYIYIIDCPNVKRLPLFFPIESGQLSPPNTLRKIYGQKEWWESLEWDIPNAMITLHPFFTTHWRYRKMMPT